MGVLRNGMSTSKAAVDKYLGTSFDIVKTVYDNLADIITTADAIDEGTISDTLFQIEIERQTGSQAVARLFTFATITYGVALDNINVYRNGQRLDLTDDYTEPSSTTLLLTFDPNDGDKFVFITNERTDTANIANASNVSYTQGGTAANTRTVQAGLRDRISVLDFDGVLYDGVTDDSTALQAGLDSLDVLGIGADIFFPPGSIRLDTQIVLPFPGHFRLLGYGCTIVSHVTEGTSGHGTSTLAYQGSSSTGSMIIQGLAFDGANTGTNGDAIWTNPKGSLYVARDCKFGAGFRHHFVHVDYVGGGGANNQAANLHLLTSEFRSADDASIILSRSDSPSVRDCLIKDNEGNAIEIGQTSTSNRSFLGSLLTGETSIASIDGNIIETNKKNGVKIYDGRGTKITSDFESNGAITNVLTSVTGTFVAGEGLTFGTDGDIGATVREWNGSDTLTIVRTGDYQLAQTVTGNTSGAVGTISTKEIESWQIDTMDSIAGGGDTHCVIGPVTKLSGKMPQIRARQGCRIQADIKETAQGCPGIVVPLVGQICDARGTSYGDSVNRFGDGTLANGGVGGILTHDSQQTYNIRSFTPSINSTGHRISSVFNLDDYIIMIIGGSIMDDTTDLPSATAEFYIRNVTDGARIVGFGQNLKWIVPVADTLDPVVRINEYGNYTDGAYNAGDDYVIYLRQTSGAANALTGHFTVQLIPYKS